MQYSNAKKGIGLIFTASIISIIAELLSGAVLVNTTLSLLNGSTTIIVSAVIGIASLVLAIVAAVQYIRGIVIAGRDEYNFKQALWIIIFDLVFSVTTVVLGNFGMAPEITKFISAAFECLVVVFICYGVSSVFRGLGNEELARKGISTATIFVVVFLLGNCIPLIMANAFTALDVTLNFIAVLAYAILSIVAYIKYLLYLNKARKEI